MYNGTNAGVLAMTGVGAWTLGLGALGVACVVVGVFALLMASGALWRIVPARWRRRSRTS